MVWPEMSVATVYPAESLALQKVLRLGVPLVLGRGRIATYPARRRKVGSVVEHGLSSGDAGRLAAARVSKMPLRRSFRLGQQVEGAVEIVRRVEIPQACEIAGASGAGAQLIADLQRHTGLQGLSRDLGQCPGVAAEDRHDGRWWR